MTTTTSAPGAPNAGGGLFAEADNNASRGRKGKLQSLGRQAVSTLYMLLRNVRMYDADNAIFSQPLEQLREVMNTVIAVDGRFELAAAGTVLALNGTIIQVDFSSLENVRHLTNELKSREMGGLSAFRPVQLEELKAFLRAFARDDQQLDDVEGLINVKVAKYKAIVEQLNNRAETEIQNNRKIDRKKYAFAVYARAVTYMKRFLAAVTRHDEHLPSVVPVARIIRDFVDICHEQRVGNAPLERNLFMGMSTVRQSSDYPQYHAVNTCIISIVVGAELGLSRDQLFDLGRSAMFHDIGVAGADQNIVNKQGMLTPAEKAELQLNPLHAAKAMLRVRPLDIGALKCIVAAHESKQAFFRLDHDANGQQRWVMGEAGLFGRIIHVVSCYDALTSARPYREAFKPDMAIQLMTTQMKHEFDPFVLATFLKLLTGLQVERVEGGTYSVA